MNTTETKNKLPITIYHVNYGLKTKMAGEITLSIGEHLNYIDLEIKELEKKRLSIAWSRRELMALKRELKQELDNEQST